MLHFEIATLKRAIQTQPEEAVCGDVCVVLEKSDLV